MGTGASEASVRDSLLWAGPCSQQRVRCHLCANDRLETCEGIVRGAARSWQ